MPDIELLPIAILFDPVSIAYPARGPIAILLDPVVTLDSDDIKAKF
jgi:hypothetical protein